jgi:hypothetical protein
MYAVWQRLDSAERQERNAPVPADKILEELLRPAVEDSNGGFENLLWIRSAASPYRDYFISLMAPVLGRFANALRRQLPAPTLVLAIDRPVQRASTRRQPDMLDVDGIEPRSFKVSFRQACVTAAERT